MKSKISITEQGLELKERDFKQSIIRVEDVYGLSLVQELLNKGWKVVQAVPMPSEITGGYIDYILEKEVNDDEPKTYKIHTLTKEDIKDIEPFDVYELGKGGKK